MGRRDAAGPRLISRNGHDFSERFPFVNFAVGALPAKSCLIDGEAIITNEAGLADFEIMRQRRVNAAAVLIAFDLLELNGEDLRGQPIEKRKRALARLLKKSGSHIVINEHFEADGATVYREACRLRCEGIMSKKLGSPYRSGRSDTWLKIKNPNAPAAMRVWEEDWGTEKPRAR
jgi:bifunctional non-homologous end joining protein LigD